MHPTHLVRRNEIGFEVPAPLECAQQPLLRVLDTPFGRAHVARERVGHVEPALLPDMVAVRLRESDRLPVLQADGLDKFRQGNTTIAISHCSEGRYLRELFLGVRPRRDHGLRRGRGMHLVRLHHGGRTGQRADGETAGREPPFDERIAEHMGQRRLRRVGIFAFEKEACQAGTARRAR